MRFVAEGKAKGLRLLLLQQQQQQHQQKGTHEGAIVGCISIFHSLYKLIDNNLLCNHELQLPAGPFLCCYRLNRIGAVEALGSFALTAEPPCLGMN
jgi:hypothetical protein